MLAYSEADVKRFFFERSASGEEVNDEERTEDRYRVGTDVSQNRSIRAVCKESKPEEPEPCNRCTGNRSNHGDRDSDRTGEDVAARVGFESLKCGEHVPESKQKRRHDASDQRRPSPNEHPEDDASEENLFVQRCGKGDADKGLEETPGD